MKNKGIGGAIYMFLWIFGIATTISVFISYMIYTQALKSDSIPAIQIIYDFIFGAFIGAVQMIWYGSENQSPKAYMKRSIVHFAILVGGCTLLMYLFGWLPPIGLPILLYYAMFVGIYIVIWAIIYKNQKKQAEEYNKKLDQLKKQAIKTKD